MIKTYLLLTVTLCWAVGATMLSYDRILYHVATGIGSQANVVAAKYAPPIEIKETVVYKEPSYAANMPPPLPISKVYNRAVGE